MLEAEAEAKSLRPRPSPKFWPRGHFGLEDLTSLVIFVIGKNQITVLEFRIFGCTIFLMWV